MNLASLLMDHPFGDGEGLLFTANDEMTAGQARTAAKATAAQLAELGVRPGQAVAIQLPNGPDVVTSMAGIWLAGAVFVPVNPRFPPAEVGKVLEATGPAAVIRPDGITALVSQRKYQRDAAFVVWTSGTTGTPKAILHSHSSYVELLDRVLGPLRSRPRDPSQPVSPNLIPVSLALNAGIYNALFGLRAGAPLVIMDRFDTTTFAQLVRRFAIRSTVLPPTALTMLTDDEHVSDLAPLRYVRSITAPLSVLQAGRFRDKFGVYVLNSYGQSEVGEVIGWTARDAKEHPDRVGAAGRPLPGVEIKIVDDERHALGPERVGTLLVRPPSMSSGYATGEDLIDRVDADGFVDTGDFARVDEQGFVWIEGRASDLIVRGGNKVFPDQVEEVLRLSPHVSDAAVVGVQEERLGEVPVAFVVADVVDEAELVALCRTHLAPYKIPVAFHRVAELPRNEVGKILRRELVARMNRS